MVAIAGVNLTSPRILAKLPTEYKSVATLQLNTFRGVSTGSPTKFVCLNYKLWNRAGGAGRMHVVRPVAAAPDSLSEKVADSVKNAEETCAGDATSGECVAAWDEVEELSAAASHARDKKKDSNPIEEYCKDNPESEECRTYDN